MTTVPVNRYNYVQAIRATGSAKRSQYRQTQSRRRPNRHKPDFDPLIQRARDPAQHCPRVAFVIGILKAADDRCSGADELGKLSLGEGRRCPQFVDFGGNLFVGARVPIVNVELNENMEFACPPSIRPTGAQRTSGVGHRRFGGLQIPGHTPGGEPRATAPTRRPASLGEAAYTDVSRPISMGVVMPSLERLAIFLGHRQAGNCRGLAPQGLPVVLDLESSSWPAWPTDRPERRSRTDS